MRALVQRVSQADVQVDDHTVGAIQQGLLILLGVHENDTAQDAAYLASKEGPNEPAAMARVRLLIAHADAKLNSWSKAASGLDTWCAGLHELQSHSLAKSGWQVSKLRSSSTSCGGKPSAKERTSVEVRGACSKVPRWLVVAEIDLGIYV